jgi:hypothetical protein
MINNICLIDEEFVYVVLLQDILSICLIEGYAIMGMKKDI